MIQTLFLLINLLFALLVFFLTLAFVTGAPFVPSTTPVAIAMIAASKLKKGMTVVDLGSGDGRLLFLAAQRGASAIGYEINPYLVLLTNIRILFSPYRKLIRCYWRNFWSTPLPNADVVYIYLLPWKMETLARKLKNELPKGAIVVSNSFIFPEWKIEQKDETNHVYSYRI